MATSNVETSKKGYAAFDKGDVNGLNGYGEPASSLSYPVTARSAELSR